MRPILFLTILLSFVALKITAINFFRKLFIFEDNPVCASICSAKVSKDLGVKLFDIEGNCARLDYQRKWHNCVKRGCFWEDRTKVLLPQISTSFLQ